MGHGRRMSTDRYNDKWEILTLRDGQKCRQCNRKPGDPTTKLEQKQGYLDTVELQIDHIDGNPHNNESLNLQFLCKGCNIKKGSNFRETKLEEVRKMQRYGKQNAHILPATRDVKRRVDYSTGDASMQVNGICELRFSDWLINEVKRVAVVNKKEAISSGAHIAGCSVLTTKRYLEKLTCSVGPLKEEKDCFGERTIVLREEEA